MLGAPEDWKPLLEDTLAQVRSGQIALTRVGDAVRRILRVKVKLGLFYPARLRRLKAQGVPVVTVFLSGRPLWVNPEINASDAP